MLISRAPWFVASPWPTQAAWQRAEVPASRRSFGRSRAQRILAVALGISLSKPRRHAISGSSALRASASAASLAQVSEGAFQVQDLGPKGMGVVAARDIEKGELLLKEQPLLVVPVVRDTRQLDAWEQRILADLADCPQQQQDSFWELADCHTEVGQKTATGIVRTNGLPIERADGADVVGLYSTMSRFNHSCIHNVNNSYQEDAGGEVLHALRNIRKGEELCITYIDLFLTRQDRQSTLQRVFNFRCTCPACSLTGEALLNSNRSRDRLQQLREALPSAAQQGLGEAVIAKIVELIDQELAGNAAAKTYTYHMGLQCFGDTNRSAALKCAQQAWKEAAIAEGSTSWLSTMLAQQIARFSAEDGAA